MNERWENVTSLFTAARILDARVRESFLHFACEGDDTLRAEVDALLRADILDGFLEDPPWASLGHALTPAIEVGQVLKNRYRIEREIATGGQALVHQATDELLNRSVVIKVMRSEGRPNTWLKSRFENEMHALAQIDHPGVVGILDVGELPDGSPFLVIQHIPGISLRETISHGPMPPSRIAMILRQMGSALHAAHALGIAHRDLKPENVMLHSPDGDAESVRLIDFGIAKIERAEPNPRTTTVILAGTVRYMAPEQFEGESSTASDVYSMALVACEMLCGHPAVRALPKSTPRRTRAALEAALAFSPKDRPSDVQAWSERLAVAVESAHQRQRRLIPAIAAAACVATAIAVGGRHWFVNRGDTQQIIEKSGGFDPLVEGFRTRNQVLGRIVENQQRTGYDAWRVISERQGAYLHSLTKAQKRRGIDRGWALHAEMRGEAGNTFAGVDFTGVGPRFDINVLEEGDHEIVRLLTQIVPDVHGLEIEQRPPGNFHVYELIYDPGLKTTDLWIDGTKRVTGYRGFWQFLEDYGLEFGAALYKSDRGSGSFKSIRLKINP